jgi:cysteine-rich repeat protein
MPGAGTAGTAEPAGDGGAATDPMGMAGADTGAGGAVDVPVDPVCGNGKLEGDEECDDGGGAGKDGCTAECRVLCSDFGPGTVESEEHHCYNGYDEADFEDAVQDCLDRGGHLVTISSEPENDIVQSFVATSKFIGGFEDVDVMSEAAGTYEWVTGEPLTYQNWDEGSDQPDREGARCSNSGPINQRCYEHCAAMQGDGTWMDQRCDLEDGYVCEWEPAGS